MAERTRTRSATRRPAEAQVLTSPLADRRLEAVGEEPVSPAISTAPARPAAPAAAPGPSPTPVRAAATG